MGTRARTKQGEPRIFFRPVGYTGKTAIWAVHASKDGWPIGDVRWFGRWRCYAFYPAADTVFEKVCLRDIARFVDEQTALHRGPRPDSGTPVS